MENEDKNESSEHHSHHHHHHHHHHHKSSSKKENKFSLKNIFSAKTSKKTKLKTNYFIIGLIIITVIFVIVSIFYVSKQNKIKSENMKKIESYEKQLDYDNENKEENIEKYGVYYKLLEGMEINGVIIGDETGLSYGVSDSENSWKTKLESALRTDYGANIYFEQLSGIGLNTIESIVGLGDKNLNYDIAVVCLGKNDDTQYFEQIYETLIHKLKQGRNIDVISVIDTSISAENSDKIKKICSFYGTDYVDMAKEMADSMYKEEKLFTNSLPNDLGYEIYAQGIMEVIKNNISIQKEISKPEGYLNQQASYFETTNKISLGSFKKEGNRYKTLTKSPYIGIMYNGKKDGSYVTVYINGEEIKSFSTKDFYELTTIDILAMGLEGTNEITIEVEEDKPSDILGILVK